MIAIGNHDFDPFPDRPSYHLRYINKHGEAIGNGHVGLVNEATVIPPGNEKRCLEIFIDKKLYLQHLLGGRACEAHRGGGGTAVTVTVT